MTFTKKEVESIEWIKSIIGDEDVDEYEALEAYEEIESIAGSLWN